MPHNVWKSNIWHKNDPVSWERDVNFRELDDALCQICKFQSEDWRGVYTYGNECNNISNWWITGTVFRFLMLWSHLEHFEMLVKCTLCFLLTQHLQIACDVLQNYVLGASSLITVLPVACCPTYISLPLILPRMFCMSFSSESDFIFTRN